MFSSDWNEVLLFSHSISTDVSGKDQKETGVAVLTGIIAMPAVNCPLTDNLLHTSTMTLKLNHEERVLQSQTNHHTEDEATLDIR